jgi:hypothetical protein
MLDLMDRVSIEAFMPTDPSKPLPILNIFLPGPDRKRSRSKYSYRVTYSNPNRIEPGCLMSWEVSGGRMPYQIALELSEAGNLRFHCTCADAVYRAEDQGRFCKHVRGLLHLGRSDEFGDQTLQAG